MTNETTQEEVGAKKRVPNFGGQFRNNPEVENFYRFIHDNHLRREASIMLESAAEKIWGKRKRQKKVKKIH
ncbi:MAG: hypothetical protein ISR65_05060 [Bacteriovoracaceae bacterium]|nr:hypothetical protein [Bacteriovoracaceae bacterium]